MNYGQITVNKRSEAVHRVVWTIYRGPIPRGMYVCHSCDNPICINPNHLFLGLCSDNIRDCVAKGRNNKPKGELNHECRLTSKQVLLIRFLEGKKTRKQIAAKFKISTNHVGAIVRREKWSHI